MQSIRVRAGVGVLLVAVAVVLFVVLSGGDDNKSDNGKSATASVQTIALKGGEPVGGIKTFTYDSGQRVRFRVTSDIEGEVHVHGYDYEKPIKAGGSVSFDFPAKLEGGYEIELHHGGGENQIAELQVQPG
jgi:hypothetical protein